MSPAPSSIEVRLFASLADKAGQASFHVDAASVDSVRGLWELLVARHPALDGLSYRPLVACDREYADWDGSLAGVREVAFLPPVSGG